MAHTVRALQNVAAIMREMKRGIDANRDGSTKTENPCKGD